MATGILGGLDATLQGFMQMSAQAERNRLANAELELARQRGVREDRQLGLMEGQFQLAKDKQASELRTLRLTEANTRVKQEGDSLLADAFTSKYYKPTDTVNPFDKAKLIADLQGSDPYRKAQARRFVLRVANHERMMGRFEEGNVEDDDFSFDNLDEQALANGRVVAVGKYRSTGAPGVSTVRGTNEPDDPVYSRDFTDAANDISVYFKGSVLNRGSNMGASSAYARSVIANAATEADAGGGGGGGGDRVGATNRVTTAVMSSVGPILGREGKRAVIAALSEAEKSGDPNAYRKVLLGITETLNKNGANIEIPSILTTSVDKNKRDKNIIEPGSSNQGPNVDTTPRVRFLLTPGAPVDPFAAYGTPTWIRGSNPLARLDTKIADATSKANKATGDARIAAEQELSKLQQQRYSLVNNINVRQFEKINSDIASLEASRNNAESDRRGAFDTKIAQLKTRRDLYIKAGYRTASMESDAYKSLETNVLSKIDGLTGDQALQLVADGRIQFSESDMAAMRVRAQEAGVTSNAQIKRLPRREQIALRAIMYSWSDNAAERESIRGEMTNLAETGILSMSRKELDTSQINWFNAYTSRMNLDLERAKFLYQQAKDNSAALSASLQRNDYWREAATKTLTDMTTMIRSGTGPDGKPIDRNPKHQGYSLELRSERVTAAVQNHLSRFVLDTRQALQEGHGKRHLQTLNAMTSTALMALAKDGTGSFWNWVGSWGNPSPDQIIGASTDFGLERVRAERDDNGNITGFRVYSAGGQRSGRFFTAKQVQDGMDPEIYKTVVAAVELSELARQSNDPNAR